MIMQSLIKLFRIEYRFIRRVLMCKNTFIKVSVFTIGFQHSGRLIIVLQISVSFLDLNSLQANRIT